MKRGELDSRLLILVTLALVAFGLVMVYSATSASATVGGSDPIYYLKRQGIYAALGIVLMIVAQRWDYRRLRALVADARARRRSALLVAVLVIGAARSTARGAGSRSGRPSSSRPSSRSSRSRSGRPRYLARKPPPRDLRELWRPVGALAAVFCVLLMLEPDLGTAIALMVMLAGDARRRGHAGARARRARSRSPCAARHRRDLARAVPPRALLRVPPPVARRAGHRLPDRAGDDRDGLGGASSASGSARASRRSSTCPRRTPT